MKKNKRFVFFSYVLVAVLTVAPATALADHTNLHTIQQLQFQLASLQQAVTQLFAVKPNSQDNKPTEEPPGQAKKTTTTPTTSQTPAQSAVPAQPSPGTGTPATPTTPAQPATPAQPVTTPKTTVPAQPKTTVKQVTPASHDTDSIRKTTLENVQKTIQTLQTKLNDLKQKIEISSPVALAPLSISAEATITKGLKRGSSGEAVQQLQGFLKQFPDVYPQGLTGGSFGPATERAVKKLQQKLGLETTGTIGAKTTERLEELQNALNRKHPPKIKEVSPQSGPLGSNITLTGNGFTEKDNAIFIRGKVVLRGIASPDTGTIVFHLPATVPCRLVDDANDNSKGSACPFKVVNAHGISNAKPFKITGAYVAPPVTPPPLSSADATPPFRSNGSPSNSLSSGTTQTVMSLLTDENATCRYATAANTGYAAMTNTFSTTGGTSHASTITALENGKNYTYSIRCQDSKGNANTDDFIISFGVATPPPPPTLTSISPSILIKGTLVTLVGTGFTETANTITFVGDPDKPNQVIMGITSSDGATLSSIVPATMPCAVVSPCDAFVSNQNGASNRITFTLGQKTDPVTVLTPNGGERLTQLTNSTVSASGGTSETLNSNVSISYALVQDSATTLTDPSEFIVGWIQHDGSSITWNTVRLCDFDNANAPSPAPGSCWTAQPGSYKILAVGKDELNQPTVWNLATGKPGNIDVSDQTFSIVPAPSISVVWPNGGEKLVYGTQVILSWETTSVFSKAVTLKLLKGGGAYQTIASNIPQSNETGSFTHAWTVPSNIPVASDYTIEISDAANNLLRDASDAPFSIVPIASISVLGPNGNEKWFEGFTGTISWSSANILNKAVTIKLFKGGTFLRVLAENIPQSYSWSTTSYTGGSFTYTIKVPSDLPAGADYTVEVLDATNPLTRDISDTAFSILIVPDPVTFSGRLTNRFTGQALANARLYSSGGVSYADANGSFSVSTTTADIISPHTKNPVGSWPVCYANWSQILYPGSSQITWSNHLFDLQANAAVPLTESVNNLGDVPMWPMTRIAFNADTSLRAFVNYPDSGYYSGSAAGGTNSTAYEVQILALNTDLKVGLWDSAGNTYYPPSIKIATENACAAKTLSYYGGQFKWEPYSITITPLYSYFPSGTAGKTFSQTFSASGGTAPLVWSIGYGALPSWLTLNATTGVLSGLPTSAGVYEFTVRTVDANGVSAARYVRITIL